MKLNNRILALGTLALAVCGAASAQTRGSFFDVTAIDGITVNQSNGGLTYEIVVGSTPQVAYDNVVYNVTDISGFYVLSDDDNLTSSATNQNGWTVNSSNSGTGGIAGWKTNPNSGLTPGQTLTFSFDSLSVASVERLGFHMRFDQNFSNTGGNTASVTGPFAPVPEPASIAALAVGAVGLLRRRNRRRK